MSYRRIKKGCKKPKGITPKIFPALKTPGKVHVNSSMTNKEELNKYS